MIYYCWCPVLHNAVSGDRIDLCGKFHCFKERVPALSRIGRTVICKRKNVGKLNIEGYCD